MIIKAHLEKTKVTQSSQLVERGSIKLIVLINNQLSSFPSLKHKRCKDLITHLQLQSPLQKVETPPLHYINKSQLSYFLTHGSERGKKP